MRNLVLGSWLACQYAAVLVLDADGLFLYTGSAVLPAISAASLPPVKASSVLRGTCHREAVPNAKSARHGEVSGLAGARPFGHELDLLRAPRLERSFR